MSKVYLKRIENYNDKTSINDTIYKLLKKIKEEENINITSPIPLKVHFGEKGNDTFITPDNFKGILSFLEENKLDSCYIDTNVLYKGSRTVTKDHIETAINHGFTDLDIVIADGDDDNMYNEIEINKKYFDKCKIGYRYKNYQNYIVISHFKGHGLAGFGGAIKQLGMGFASRGGKLHQHSDIIPIVNEDLCISCGECSYNCPVNAINIEDYAIIDSNKCIGCAKCSIVCPVDAIGNDWGGSNFYEKLAEYAYAASLNKNNIYITYAFNITDECDCCGEHMEFVTDHIGIFISTDPVSIDKAVLDEINKKDKLFNAGLKTLIYAEEIGLGSLNYELIEI